MERNIGQEVACLIAAHSSEELVCVGALVRHTESSSHNLVTTLPALLTLHPQVMVEVAGHAGLKEHEASILRMGIDLFVVSTGALAEPTVMQALFEAAQQGQSHLTIVSGAIGALDSLAAAAGNGGLTKVVHTMRKPPHAFFGEEEASALQTVSEVFRGSARQAVLRFPTFLNIAAAVALAGRGFDQTEVLVLADPGVEHSIHEVVAEGSFGRFCFQIDYAPTHVTSLVAQSITHTLLLRRRWLCIG